MNKLTHQTTMIALKWLPAVMAFSFLGNTICTYFQSSMQAVVHYVGLVIAPFAFLYLTSFVFKFCWYHRIFIHYVVIVEMLNITDWYFRIPLSNEWMCRVHFIISAIFLVVAAVTFFVKRPKKKGRN